MILISDLIDYRINDKLVFRSAESAEIFRSFFLIGTIRAKTHIDPVLILHDFHPLSA